MREVSGEQQVKKSAPVWRRNIYTRPARGSAAGGGYATAEDLLRFARSLFENRLLTEAWTDWVFSGIEPAAPAGKATGEKAESRNRDNASATVQDKGSLLETLAAKADVKLSASGPGDRIPGAMLDAEKLQIKTDRSRWNLAIAGGAPGINAVLEFEATTGYTIIVLSNYDPPAAMQISRMIRRHLKAVKAEE